MRVLLLQSPAHEDGDDLAQRVASTLAAGADTDPTLVRCSGAIVPDLDEWDVVHLLVDGPIEIAVRQFWHARRWGRAVVASVGDAGAPAHLASAAGRYERALWQHIGDGADRMIDVTEARWPGGGGVVVPLTEAGAEAALRAIYAEAIQERQAMTDQGDVRAEQWVPLPSAEEYAKHLEDLVQLQLELIAHRDAEYDALSAAIEQRMQSLATEYHRVNEWSQQLAAQNAIIQDEHAQLQRWAGDLEAQLREAKAGGVRARMARLLRRR